MFEAYRAMKTFQWDGWYLAPNKPCNCGCPSCTNQTATSCPSCSGTSCHCRCSLKQATYGGDVWLVMAGHSRKDMMLANRFATYDASLPPIDELVNDPQYSRLLRPPDDQIRQAAIQITTKRR